MRLENQVRLRPVETSDLPVFFEHQRDPQAVKMAAFPSREHDVFMAHWKRSMTNTSAILRTILFEGKVAGNV